MRTLQLMLGLCVLVGCDSVVHETVHYELRKEEAGFAQCSKGMGYCCAAGLGLDGKYGYGCRMQYNCPGRRAVIYVITPITRTHESGKVSTVERRDVLRRTGPCH